MINCPNEDRVKLITLIVEFDLTSVFKRDGLFSGNSQSNRVHPCFGCERVPPFKRVQIIRSIKYVRCNRWVMRCLFAIDFGTVFALLL